MLVLGGMFGQSTTQNDAWRRV